MYTPYADTDNKTATPAPRQNPMLAVLGSPPYRLLWSAQFVSGLAGFFNYVAMAWLTLLLTGSNLAVGTVLAAAAAPLAIFMLVGGAISDRFSARNTMLSAGIVRGAVMAALAVLALTHAIQFWHLVAGAILVGITSAFYYPASTSILPRLVDRSQLEAGNALLNLSRTAAVVLGPAIAGVVVAAVGAGWALAGDAAASALSAALVVPLPAGAGGAPSRSSGNPFAGVRDGALHVWRDVPLRAVLLVVAVLNFFALGAINVGLPALAHQRLTEGAIALGTAFGAWGVGSTIGSLLSATRPAPSRFGPFVVAVVAVFGAGIAAMGLSPNLPVLLVVMVVVGVVEGASTTYLISWMQRRTDPGMQGRVMSLALLSSVGLQPVALALAGALASTHLGLLFWISAGAVLLTAAGAGLTRSVREM